MAYSWGTGQGIYFDKDLDRYVYGSVTDRYKDMIAYLGKAYREGVLDPDFVNLPAQQWREKLASGKSFFFYDNPTYGQRANADIAPRIPGAWFEPTPVLQNPYGGRRSLFYDRNRWAQWAVGKHTKNADTIARLMNFLYSSEAAVLKAFGIEGVHWEKVGDDIRYREEFLKPYAVAQGGYNLTKLGADLGTGNYSDLTPYLDMRVYRYTWPEYQLQWYAEMEKDAAWSDPVLAPPLSKAERSRIADVSVKVDTILRQAVDRMILGDVPFSEYDKVREEAKRIGATEIEKIYNDALARYRASRK